MTYGPPGLSPLNYAGPREYSLPPGPPARRGGKILGWVLFIALALMLALLLTRRSKPPYGEIALSDFAAKLRAGNVEWVTVSDTEVSGKFETPQTLASGRVPVTVTHFRTQLPNNVAGSWPFTQWLLDNANGARIEADNGGNLLVNIVVPLIPWVLIFGFIWFFVFRQLRGQGARPPQPWPVVVVNPGALNGGPGGSGAPDAHGPGPSPGAPTPPPIRPQTPGA
jgi:hypothetical protein